MRNFQADLKRGQQGEQDFLKLFTKLVGTDGRKGDIVAPDGKIELKTDFYPMTTTPNFFIERFSSVEVLSPGGPWQAAAHGCKYFVYYYTTAGYGYIFDTQDLVQQLEKLEGKLKPIEVKNRRWTTIGYKVPRELLKPIAVFNTHDCTDSIAMLWGFRPK